jgi:hypothetical protein
MSALPLSPNYVWMRRRCAFASPPHTEPLIHQRNFWAGPAELRHPACHAVADKPLMVSIAGSFPCSPLPREDVALRLGTSAKILCPATNFAQRDPSCHAVPDESFMVPISGCLSGASLSREHVTLGIAWQVLGVCRRANADCECGRECKQNCSHSPFSLLKAAMLSK